MFASYADFALVAGTILALGSLIPIFRGLTDDDFPIGPLVIGMMGLGLLGFAFYQHRFDISLMELFDAFERVFANLFRNMT